MKLDEVLSRIVGPALAMLPMGMDTAKARVMLLAIGLQESKFQHRYQVLNDPSKKGPARGFWQFERGGGVKGVMTHSATAGHAHRVCADRNVPWDPTMVWVALEHDDLLACVFARLLMYSDPKPLPQVSDPSGGWDLYERVWRPGKPHPLDWPANHRAAREAV